MIKTLDDLPEYDPDAGCPKCGHPTVNESYNHPRMGIPTRDEVAGALKRTCDRCGYTWNERPLDYTETGGDGA